MFTTLYINFSDAQGQITLESMVVSGRNWNSSKLSCMSLLPIRMKMIHTKMKELEWSQHFSHYKSMGIFPDAQGQVTQQSVFQFGRISNSSVMFWLSLLPASMKKILSKMKVQVCSQDFPVSCHGNQSSNPIWPKTECSLSPHPNDASDKIWLRSANWSQRYSCLKV